MSKGKLKAELPTLPHPDFFRDPKHSIMSDDGAALLSYDATTRSGFVYHIESKAWSISAPIDFTTWALLVRMTGYTVSDCEDARRWFRACCPNPAGDNVVDFISATRH